MHIEFFHEDGAFWWKPKAIPAETAQHREFDYILRTRWATVMWSTPLFHISERGKFQRLIFKAAANDNYPYSGGAHVRDAYCQTLSALADLHLDERTSESCILYINGQYWGVYEYREKVDDSDFTRRYYDQSRYDIDFKTWEAPGKSMRWRRLVRPRGLHYHQRHDGGGQLHTSHVGVE